jgi:hypothetical protein
MPQNDLKVVSNQAYLQKAKSVLVTQAEFARHIGTSRQYVSKLIRLGKLVPLGRRINLAEGLAAIAARPGARALAHTGNLPSK